jgi:hypothetical protein
MRAFTILFLVSCSSSTEPADLPDAASAVTLGTVSTVTDTACPGGLPQGSACKHVIVRGCPAIEAEELGATVAIVETTATLRGTIAHFKGGGGEGLETIGLDPYRAAGFRQVFVSWDADWEQTASHGIKTAGCRPATLLRWIFDVPHGGVRDAAFCGQGKSGGSAQLGYALAHYGGGEILDYVNEFAGPPFARIDLGCDGDAPATTTICGDEVTMRLPDKVGAWENLPGGLMCGSTNVPAAELARWRDDSIAYGGVYDHPRTHVEFFDCTYMAPAVTGMSKLYYDQIAAVDPSRAGYHCYRQADGCRGESLGDAGYAEAIQSMIDGCVPRHR